MSAQLVVSFDGITVGSGEIHYGLACNVESSLMPNVQVHAVDFSLSDPSAIIKITLERIEYNTESGSTMPRWFRGKPGNNNHYRGGQFSTPTVVHRLGRYIFSGGMPLQLSFPEVIEAIKDAETSTDHLFAIAVQRLDSESGVNVYSNIWYSEV